MMMVMRKPLGESCHYLVSNIWIMLYELSVLFLSCSYPQFSSSEEAAAIEEIYKRMMTVMRKPLGESCHYLLSNI